MNRYSDFLSDKRVISLVGFNQNYACVMVSLFSLMPILAIFAPEKFGSLFAVFSNIEIIGLLVLAFFQLVSYASFDSDEYSLGTRIKICFSNMCTSLFNNKTALLLLAVYFISIISAVFAKDTQRAFFGTEFRPDGIFMYTSYAAVFIFSSLIKGRIQRRVIFGINIAGFIICSIIMLQQYYGIIGTAGVKSSGEFGKMLMNIYDKNGIRIGHFFKGMTGSFYNPNHMGYYIMVNSMIISALLVISKKWYAKLALMLLAAYSYYILTLNDTFGCYLAVEASLVIIPVVIFLKFRKKCMKLFLNSLIPLALFLMVSMLFYTFSASDNVVSKNYAKLGDDVKSVAGSENLGEDKSGSGRMSLWVATIDMIGERPLLGYGPDNLKEHYVQRDQNVDRAHNEPLEIAVSTGIPSALIYYTALIWGICGFIRRRFSVDDKDMLIAFALLLGYLISSLFGVFLFYTAYHFIIALAFVSSDAFGHTALEEHK